MMHDRQRSILRRLVPMAMIGCFGWWPRTMVARTYVVHRAHQAAADHNPGTERAPLRTIQRAAQLAEPGDTVFVRAGIYRERVAPARGGREGQPITYQAAPGELVIIKGSEVWHPPWKQAGPPSHIYRARLDPGLFQNQRINPYRERLKGMPTGKQLTLGQLFVDGQPLREVDTDAELSATMGTWLAIEGGAALKVHFSPDGPPPGRRFVEVTVRERIFAPHRRNLGYIHVKNFTMEHCANQFPDKFWRSDSPQAGALGCRAGHHWLIEGNTIRFAKSIGIDCGFEGKRDLEGNQPTPQNTGFHVLRNNVVADNGCCGIAGMRSTGTRIIGNVILRNNWNHHISPEIGGIKVHYFVDGTIEGNLIADNDAYGIWLDNVYRNARVTRNLVVRNRGAGIFVELGAGPVLIDNNVVGQTRPSLNTLQPRGDGIYSHDASGINLVHNLVFGNHRFGSFHRKATQRAGAGVSRIKLFNNIFIGNRAGRINLPLTGLDARDNRADCNLFGPGGDFLVNHSGSPQPDELSQLESIFGQEKPSLWNGHDSRLNLGEWRGVRFGARSVETSQADATLSDDFVLTLRLEAVPPVTAQPWPTLERDFLGHPILPNGAIVGPFQRLEAGKNTLHLWHPGDAGS